MKKFFAKIVNFFKKNKSVDEIAENAKLEVVGAMGMFSTALKIVDNSIETHKAVRDARQQSIDELREKVAGDNVEIEGYEKLRSQLSQFVL